MWRRRDVGPAVRPGADRRGGASRVGDQCPADGPRPVAARGPPRRRPRPGDGGAAMSGAARRRLRSTRSVGAPARRVRPCPAAGCVGLARRAFAGPAARIVATLRRHGRPRAVVVAVVPVGQPRPTSTVRRQRCPSRVSSTVTPARPARRAVGPTRPNRVPRAPRRAPRGAPRSPGRGHRLGIGQDAEYLVEVAERLEGAARVGGRHGPRARSAG